MIEDKNPPNWYNISLEIVKSSLLVTSVNQITLNTVHPSNRIANFPVPYKALLLNNCRMQSALEMRVEVIRLMSLIILPDQRISLGMDLEVRFSQLLRLRILRQTFNLLLIINQSLVTTLEAGIRLVAMVVSRRVA